MFLWICCGFGYAQINIIGFLGLAGEYVIGVVGLVLMPFGHPGGSLEGKTCEGALAL